jgi:chromate transport protein ChrA
MDKLTGNRLLWMALLLLVTLCSSLLLSHGMFMDGVIYAVIGKQVAFDPQASWWNLTLSPQWDTEFREHPPLAMWLLAICYKILGDHDYVEKLYSLGTGIVTALLLVRCWKMTITSKAPHTAGWPVLFWVTIPTIGWAYNNNILENTMGIFTLLSVIAQIRFAQTSRWWHIFLAAIWLLLAFLCKGPFALFPLATLMVYWLCVTNISFGKAFKASVLQLLVWTGLFVLLLQYPPAHDFFLGYWNKQVVESFEKEVTVTNRFQIVINLAIELLPAIGICLIVAAVRRFRSLQENSFRNYAYKYGFFFLLVALSASLPIMISKKQSTFYAMGSMPFFAMSLACFFLPMLQELSVQLAKPMRKVLLMLIILLAGTSLTLMVTGAGKARRDTAMVTDIIATCQQVPRGSTIAVCSHVNEQYNIRAYMLRYGSLHMTNHEPAQKQFYFSDGCGELDSIFTKKAPLPEPSYQLSIKP